MTIQELEDYFSKANLPKSIKVAPHHHILDVKKMVKTHLEIVKSNKENEYTKPYKQRLIELYNILNK
jgi:hypothetical protein